MAEKVFVEGITVKKPSEKAPAWIKMSERINRDEHIEWLKAQAVDDNGYLTIEIKESKSGKLYAELDTWKRDPDYQPPGSTEVKPKSVSPAVVEDVFDCGVDDEDNLPF